MRLKLIKAGLQTSLQGGPRSGYRHIGVPASGAADMLSLALANRLVGNRLYAPALEITLSGLVAEFETPGLIALTGGQAALTLNARIIPAHQSFAVKAGDRLEVGPIRSGCRLYLALQGEIEATPWLGSPSTYLPAKLGGQLYQDGDHLASKGEPRALDLETPPPLRPFMGHSWTLRAIGGAEFEDLPEAEQNRFFSHVFNVSARANRMGVGLIGPAIEFAQTGQMASVPVFPGTLQWPPKGEAFLLLSDAQTSGGYPRLVQTIRADRHLLGQLRPFDRLQFQRVTPDQARRILKAKTKLLQDWLGDDFHLF